MRRPTLSDGDITQLVKRLYGMKVSHQRRLVSYDDVNVHVTTAEISGNSHIDVVCADGYVVKILNSEDSKMVEFVDAMQAAIAVSVQNGILTPRPVMNVTGEYFSLEVLHTEPKNDSPTCAFLVRLFEYVPGHMLNGKPYTPHLYHSVGRLAGRLDRALKTFTHPGFAGHVRYWSLTEVENLRRKILVLDDERDRRVVQDVVMDFTQNVVTNYHRLQKGVIHGDLNSCNLLVKPLDRHPLDEASPPKLTKPINADHHTSDDANANTSHDVHQANNQSAAMDSSEYTVHAVLDYGDSMEGYHVFEVAIAMMYMMIQCKTGDPVESAGHVLAGYLQEFELPTLDLSLLKECVCGRLAQCLTNGEAAHKKDPTNEYCMQDAVVARPLLHIIWNITKEELHAKWQAVLDTYPGGLSC